MVLELILFYYIMKDYLEKVWCFLQVFSLHISFQTSSFPKQYTDFHCGTGKQTCNKDRCILVPYSSSTTKKYLRN